MNDVNEIADILEYDYNHRVLEVSDRPGNTYILFDRNWATQDNLIDDLEDIKRNLGARFDYELWLSDKGMGVNIY